jgi:hypothetical protein
LKVNAFVPLALLFLVCSIGATESTPNLDVTPMTTYSDADTSSSAISFSGAYTRLIITSRLAESNDNAKHLAYPAGTTRTWLQNMVVGQQYDVNLAAKLKVGEYEETVPLITLSRTSDKNGDSWIRDITHDRRSFPWFSVNSGADASVPRIAIDFNGSKRIGSGVAGTALQVALAGIKMVAPEAGVVTRLSTNTAKDKAAAIDQIIGKLFSNKLNERHTSERDLTKWSPGGGLNVELSVPVEDAKWDGKLSIVGIWNINFEPPRASIFSDWYICATEEMGKRCKTTLVSAAVEAVKEIEMSKVLAHPLIKTSAGDLSIKDYLHQQSWFTAAESTLSGVEQLDQWQAEGLCRATMDAMLKLGLNFIDSRLVVRAVVTGMQHNKSAHPTTWTGPNCTKSIT